MSSGNSYTYIVMNQKPFSVSLMVHRNKQGVETAKKQHISILLQNRTYVRNMPLAKAHRPVGCSSLHLSTSPPPRFDTSPPPKKAHLHPPKSTSPPPKKVHFIPPLKFFQRTKTTKLKVKVNVFAAQVHVEDLVVAHIEQNMTMNNAKRE